MTAPDTERPAGLDCLDPRLALPLWRQQDFRLLWGAQVVSTLGSHAVGIVVDCCARCGDVTEVKSGPAFNQVENSRLVAVMRRNGDLARDYATRHAVPFWSDSAAEVINHPEVNAVYIATPPGSHR